LEKRKRGDKKEALLAKRLFEEFSRLA